MEVESLREELRKANDQNRSLLSEIETRTQVARRLSAMVEQLRQTPVGVEPLQPVSLKLECDGTIEQRIDSANRLEANAQAHGNSKTESPKQKRI